MTWGSILVSAVLAGIVATAVTVAIEKWGGLIGGLLGTVPSTIVPAAVGMHLAGGEEALMASMSVVPLGMGRCPRVQCCIPFNTIITRRPSKDKQHGLVAYGEDFLQVSKRLALHIITPRHRIGCR